LHAESIQCVGDVSPKLGARLFSSLLQIHPGQAGFTRRRKLPRPFEVLARCLVHFRLRRLLMKLLLASKLYDAGAPGDVRSLTSR
jgi:hypothetical protein